jgi:hypothetical protein
MLDQLEDTEAQRHGPGIEGRILDYHSKCLTQAFWVERSNGAGAPDSVRIEPEEAQVIFTEKGMSFVMVKGRKPIEIRVVEGHSCPFCGSKFPNIGRKIHDKEGWWWRCYTEGYPVGYFQP